MESQTEIASILVVDDVKANLKLLSAIVTAAGYDVSQAENGEQALKTAMASPPDLILLDIKMPGMDGFEVCKELKADQRVSIIPVIFISALSETHNRVTGFQVGGVDYITKPFQAEEVLARIRTHLEIHRMQENLEQVVAERTAELSDMYMKTSQSEAKYRRLVENLQSDYIIYSHDKNDLFRYVSPSITNALGYTQAEFSTHYTEYLTDNPINKNAKRMIELALGGEMQPAYESEIYHKDGGIRHLMISETPIINESGEVEAVEGIAHDITEQKEAQEADRIHAIKLRNSLLQTIQAIARTEEKRNPYTADHQERVSELAVAIGNKMGLSAEKIEGLRLGSLIHDIGKVFIPAEILNRPGKLSNPEFELIKSHPTVGYEIIKDVDFPWPVAEIIMQHHERMDGSGYPNGLHGDDIILEARIVSVADVVEAVVSHRPYRPALGFEKAIKIIKEGRGTFFDSDITDVCIELLLEHKFEWSSSVV